MPKVTRIFQDENGHTIHEYETGTQKDVTTNRLIKPPKHTLITAENSQAFKDRRKQLRAIAKAKGKIIGTGLELPDDADLEELAAKEHDADVLLVAHTTKTYMNNKSLRGMEGILPRLLDEGERAKIEQETGKPVSVMELLGREAVMEFLARAKAIREAQEQEPVRISRIEDDEGE